jgi:CRISPR-associated protein Csb2
MELHHQTTSYSLTLPKPATGAWPFAEAWHLELSSALPRWALRLDRRVAVAVAVHRALVAAIGADVPAFVSGRDGHGPLQGAGHLAIHLVRAADGRPEVVLGLPVAVQEADRATLLDALAARPTVRLGRRAVRLGYPVIGSALPFWPRKSSELATVVPMVLDTAGTPRRGSWTLDDAVICSVGYALRGALEDAGMIWGRGWRFRQALVEELRGRGVQARARRVPERASLFVHRAPPGALLVAADALVTLGNLAPAPGGLLALGRSRHLGGGLLAPLDKGEL